MDWAAYSQSLTQAWIEAQTTLWRGWANLAGQPSPAKAEDLLEPWRKLAQQSMDSWSAGAAPIAKATTEQFFAVQETAIRFIEFSTRLWEAAGPKFAAGEDWSAALAEAVEGFRQRWAQLPQTGIETAQDMQALWDLYLKQWRQFGQPWEAAFQQAPEYAARIIAGDSSALAGLSNLYREAYQQTLARLAASPGLGLTRQFNEKIQQGFDSFVSWQLATLEYQGVLSEIWDRAFKQFADDLVSLAEKGETIENLRDFVLLWTRGAEQVFTEAFRSEQYVLAQGKMLNAGMAYRIHERAIIEEYLKLYDLPTRSELDETHRRIYELRKEVKALKKQLADIRAGAEGGG